MVRLHSILWVNWPCGVTDGLRTIAAQGHEVGSVTVSLFVHCQRSVLSTSGATGDLVYRKEDVCKTTESTMIKRKVRMLQWGESQQKPKGITQKSISESRQMSTNRKGYWELETRTK